MSSKGACFAVCCLAALLCAASEPLLADLRTDAGGHTELAAVPADQMFIWLNAAANHTGALEGYVYHETSECLDSTSCTQAAQVAISQWSRNVNNSADLPIDCSAYMLLTAQTSFVGLNATWQQLYNPLAQYYVAATKDQPDAHGDCGWVVKMTPGTEELLQKAYPSSDKAMGTKGGSCGDPTNLCCNPKACDCFPGDSTVQMEDGSVKSMSQLQLGDKVATSDDRGRVSFDTIYAFGHRDHSSSQSFVKLSTATKTLRLTSGHFLKASSGPSAPATSKRAADVVPGDYVWAQSADDAMQMAMQEITETSTAYETGLFNPFTLGGSIIVDGVAASAHSEWFMDQYFTSPRLVSLLPSMYQVILAPARAMWYLLGKDNYVAAYEQLDQMMGLDQLGIKYGGIIFGATSTVMAGALVAVIGRKVM